MTPRWTQYDEPRIGASDPYGRADTYNRANQDIWANFCRHGTDGHGEHDRDGAHCADLLSACGAWLPVVGTYTGNGTDGRTITLASNVVIKMLRIIASDLTYSFTRPNTADGDLAYSSEGAVKTDYVQALSTGAFEVGTSLNVNNIVYYYAAYGPVAAV